MTFCDKYYAKVYPSKQKHYSFVRRENYENKINLENLENVAGGNNEELLIEAPQILEP